MARVDFVISNDRHHLAMTRPVVTALVRDGECRCRVLSLCELRGLATPTREQPPTGSEIRKVVPLRLRRSPSVGLPAEQGRISLPRRAFRALSWLLLVGPRLGSLLRRRPDLVVLPNDAAFPYDRIARLLRTRRIPFLLLQEGIRFPLPGQADEPTYGTGGALAVAAWGEASAEYFRAAGVPEERIHLTGNPRFDRLAAMADDGQRELARGRHGLPRRTLLLASNPIDDQGFCSHQEKIALIGSFVEQLEPLLADPEFHLAIKLHGRESSQEIRPLIGEAMRERVSIFTDAPLWELLSAATAVVVLASTVGLEALLCGSPLAVLEIPGHGFQYDYVQSRAATGLSWSAPLAPQVESLLEPSSQRQAPVDAYMRRQFGTRHQATEKVSSLIRALLADSR
jgi:hypothetical protein